MTDCFSPMERFISVKDRTIGPMLREGLEEIQEIVDKRKNEEVKLLQDQYEATIEVQKKQISNMSKTIDDAQEEFKAKAQEILDIITEQRKAISSAGNELLNSNDKNKQLLLDLIQLDKQETLAEKFGVIVKAMTDHSVSYNKVVSKLKNKCKKNKEKNQKLEETVKSKDLRIDELKNELDICKTENKNLSKNIDKLENDLSILEQCKHEFMEEIDNQNDTIKELKNDNNCKDNQIIVLEQKDNDNITIVQNLTNQVSSLEMELLTQIKTTEEQKTEIENHNHQANKDYEVVSLLAKDFEANIDLLEKNKALLNIINKLSPSIVKLNKTILESISNYKLSLHLNRK